jgi:hypothetical protein
VRLSRTGPPVPADGVSNLSTWTACTRFFSTHQIRLPQPLTRPEQLVTRRPRHDEILCKINAPNTVKPAYERLSGRMIDSSQHRTDEERAKPPLVETAADQIGERLGCDLSLLAEPVHVDFVAEEVGYGADVGRQTGEPEVARRGVVEDLGEVVGDGEGLQAEAEVAGYGDAVFADHCDAGAAIWWN